MASRNVRYATVYLFPGVDKRQSIRANATPETLTACPGDVVDWTVVDATGRGGKVEIKWKKGSPLKEEPKAFERAVRSRIRRGAKGRYRYSILLNGVEVFDPEIEVVK